MKQAPRALAELIQQWSDAEKGLPPVHTWAPSHRGTIDIRIDGDGVWWHEGEQIKREALVTLFASILRRGEDGHYVLVTPVEALQIAVEDVPFSVVDVDVIETDAAQPVYVATTSQGEQVPLDADHPLRSARSDSPEPGPAYVCIRPARSGTVPCQALEGRLTRSAWYRLADNLVVEDDHAVLHSGGVAHRLAL